MTLTLLFLRVNRENIHLSNGRTQLIFSLTGLLQNYIITGMIQEQLIKKERFTSIQSAQAGLTNILMQAQKGGNFYRVLRNNEPLGVLIPNNVWENLLEDIEGINSPNYINSIQEARKSSKLCSAKKIKEQLNIK